jgi:predicted metal-binding protein
MAITPRRASVDMHEGELDADLQRYVQHALNGGAVHATAMRAADIPVDDRVVLKCRIPRCFGYGVSANCPPHAPTPAEMRHQLEGYQWALFFSVDVEPRVIVRDKATIVERIAAYQTVYDIVNSLESRAFYDGHYLAFGLGAGSCRHTFCSQAKDCAAVKGERCRFSLKSRPSLEAVGIDVYQMYARLGWEIYPAGSGMTADDLPCGSLAGLVVVQ